MQEEIGKTAGTIWDALNTRGEQSLSELKKAVKRKEPTFDWAIGWLAREDQIVITPEKRSFRIRLKQAQASRVVASVESIASLPVLASPSNTAGGGFGA